jgi:hypothetical protein
MDALNELEIRILGTLIEKSLATPEYYPLTLKSLRAGCNQATNRIPVTDYEEIEIEEGVKSLKLKGLVYFVEPKGGSEVRKFEHTLFEEHRWGLSKGQVALFGMLLLRGEQTASELRSRVREKMIDLSPAQTEELLEATASMEDSVVFRVPRQPGQREPRWRHYVSIEERGETAASGAASDDHDTGAVHHRPGPISKAQFNALADRVRRLEDQIQKLLGH